MKRTSGVATLALLSNNKTLKYPMKYLFFPFRIFVLLQLKYIRLYPLIKKVTWVRKEGGIDQEYALTIIKLKSG